ncbi:nicotinate (nicotinamide) nucleotide adenylyltransferase [bacterium]|nr:nicotinate (nicotinamide) nucleotide adenylyltransferase [bacterium]
MAQSAKRIGLLGGSFNPIHFAHLLLAQEVWHRLELTRVMFIPAAQNPLKNDPHEYAASEHRLNMVRLAVDPDARFDVDATEIRRGGKSYMIDTLMRYQEREPGCELHLLMGADAALTLPDWKDVRLYAGLCTVVVCNRPGSDDLSAGWPAVLSDLGLRYEYLPLPPLDVSSSEIRRRLGLGKPVRYFVPDAVAEYLHQHSVYS